MERSMAARLMAISDCLSNVDNRLHLRLPASVSTPYHMSRLEHQVLEAGFRDGTFTTETTAKQVQALLPPPEPKKPPSRLNQIRRFINKPRQPIKLQFSVNPVPNPPLPPHILKTTL